MKKKKSIANTIWIVILTIAALAWIYPIIMILMNSLKKESAISTGTAFKLPTADAFAGIANYVDAIASKGFLSSLGYSTFITITSVVAILVCCSMCAWYITRVNSPISKILYYLFVFSMVVPFQMVMFTLSQTADTLHLNMPWNIWVIYLGFGAGLAVFMFCGFVKSIPVEIEEAAMIDGCNPLQTAKFFRGRGLDAFSEDQLAQVGRQRQAAGLQTFFQRGAFVLIQPNMQIILILPHGAPFSARRRHFGVRVFPASCLLVPKGDACALAARRREPDAPLFSGAREERDFNFLFLIDAFALLRPFKLVFEWRSRYISRYEIQNY